MRHGWPSGANAPSSLGFRKDLEAGTKSAVCFRSSGRRGDGPYLVMRERTEQGGWPGRRDTVRPPRARRMARVRRAVRDLGAVRSDGVWK